MITTVIKRKKYNAEQSTAITPDTRHFKLEISADHVIYVEPIGRINGPIVEGLLTELKKAIERTRSAGHPVYILVNIGSISGHDSASRIAVKQASKLGFDRGAAYGGPVALGLVMQYLQRSIDPKRARYFRTKEAALDYLLQGTQHFGNPAPRPKNLRFIALSCILLAIVACTTYLGWAYTSHQATVESQGLFRQKAQQTQSELQKRMQVYVQTLYGFRGLYSASHSVERNEFHAYFNTLNLTAAFPGFTTISFVQHVTNAAKANYALTVKQDASINGKGYPDFQIYPAATKASYDVVTYAEPSGTFGYDLSSDPLRTQTLAGARDSGDPTASATVTIGSTPPAKGFFVTIPIYSGSPPITQEQRRQRIFGYVNAVFTYSKFFADALFAVDDSAMKIAVTDDANQTVYSEGRAVGSLQTASNPITIGGRTFGLTFSAPTAYGVAAATGSLPAFVLAGGAAAAGLLVLVLLTLLRSRSRAVALANTMTEDLERERNLALANQEKLEQAEHDLKQEKANVEHKVVERTRELNEARAQLEASVRSLPFGFAIVNNGRQIVFSNGSLGNILDRNVPTESAQSASFLQQLSKDLGYQLDIMACLTQAEVKRSVVQKDASFDTRFLHFLFVPIIASETESGHPDKHTVGSVMIVEDTTEEKALQRSRDEFFSIASHELRTPLTVIRGNTSMALEHYEQQLREPDLHELIADTHDASLRLIAIVNDFLDMSRLEQGKFVIHTSEVDVVSLAEDVIHEFQVSAEGKNIYLKVDAKVGEAHVTADKDRVHQILLNLVGNAIRFTKTGGITITVEKTGQTITASVTDTGDGIPHEAQHLLFRKFQQASDNILTRDSSQSTGLGLYISRLMAELMGGKLYFASSEVGKGTTFALDLPSSH